MSKSKTERPPQLRPPGIFGLRVKRDFTCEGRRFRTGTLVSVDNDLVMHLRRAA